MALKEINVIDDMLSNEGNFKSGEEIFMQLEGANRANWLIEYKTLLNANQENERII